MKLTIDIDEAEYTALSKISEKEKVNELSYYERAIANGIPYKERPKGEWIYKRVDTQRCGNIHGCNICGQEVESFSTDYQNRPCAFNFCPNCGAEMQKGESSEKLHKL